MKTEKKHLTFSLLFYLFSVTRDCVCSGMCMRLNSKLKKIVVGGIQASPKEPQNYYSSTRQSQSSNVGLDDVGTLQIKIFL